jgi:hypothetical protein
VPATRVATLFGRYRAKIVWYGGTEAC